LELGITQLSKQEFSKQAASIITGLISTEANSESEACEVEVLKSSTVKHYTKNTVLSRFFRTLLSP
jgi:hypothetical protein